MSEWRVVYTKQAQKDAKKLAASGLRERAETLIAILAHDPFRRPPPFEQLVGDLAAEPKIVNVRRYVDALRVSPPTALIERPGLSPVAIAYSLKLGALLLHRVPPPSSRI